MTAGGLAIADMPVYQQLEWKDIKEMALDFNATDVWACIRDVYCHLVHQ